MAYVLENACVVCGGNGQGWAKYASEPLCHRCRGWAHHQMVELSIARNGLRYFLPEEILTLPTRRFRYAFRSGYSGEVQ